MTDWLNINKSVQQLSQQRLAAFGKWVFISLLSPTGLETTGVKVFYIRVKSFVFNMCNMDTSKDQDLKDETIESRNEEVFRVIITVSKV